MVTSDATDASSYTVTVSQVKSTYKNTITTTFMVHKMTKISATTGNALAIHNVDWMTTTGIEANGTQWDCVENANGNLFNVIREYLHFLNGYLDGVASESTPFKIRGISK